MESWGLLLKVKPEAAVGLGNTYSGKAERVAQGAENQENCSSDTLSYRAL